MHKQYFGIKTPDGLIWWIGEDEHRAWDAFFTYPNNRREMMPHRAPLAEAINAYKAIGYECIELDVKEKRLVFTPEKVTKLNAYQQSGRCHPYTCESRHANTEAVLVATVRGWICPYCDYTQDWVHASSFM